MFRFKIDGSLSDDLTWDEIEVLESRKVGAAKNIIARYLVNDNDEPIPLEEAKRRLGKLKGKEIEKAVEDFANYLQDTVINPQTAASS